MLAYAIPFLVSDYSLDGSCKIVECQKVLEALQLSPSYFLDFVIMCGCDFNENIPLIGCVKSLKLIQQYKSIENIQQSIGKAPTNYERCRQIFTNEYPLQEINYT
jgi:5'-3' exonuclease